ncbi:PspC domain-containing protein [Deinococcus lacus]|uniref:PspC domain-containing protein n=1 Tax=Deinococcus lacus TaxID=392561 RepID=A0ABW1YE30_9DEIO
METTFKEAETGHFYRDLGRSRVAGVAAGLQRSYWPDLDLTVLRAVIAVAFSFTPLGPGLAALYLLLWLLAPAR